MWTAAHGDQQWMSQGLQIIWMGAITWLGWQALHFEQEGRREDLTILYGLSSGSGELTSQSYHSIVSRIVSRIQVYDHRRVPSSYSQMLGPWAIMIHRQAWPIQIRRALLLTCAGGAERIGARLYPSGEYEVHVTPCWGATVGDLEGFEKQMSGEQQRGCLVRI